MVNGTIRSLSIRWPDMLIKLCRILYAYIVSHDVLLLSQPCQVLSLILQVIPQLVNGTKSLKRAIALTQNAKRVAVGWKGNQPPQKAKLCLVQVGCTMQVIC